MDYFNNFKYEHPGDLVWRSIELKMIEKLLVGLKVQEPILDLGCGNGDVSNMLFPGKKIFGVDIVTEFINDVVHWGDLTRLDGIKNNSYETVFSNCVIEHIVDLETALAEVQRVLKPDGLFIFTVTSPFFLKNLLFKEFLYRWLRGKRAGIHNGHHYIQDWYKMLMLKKMCIFRAEYFCDKRSTLLFDRLAWVHALGLDHTRYLDEMLYCYEHDKGRWGASGIAMIARKLSLA